ncbi:unnamed protein product [Brassica rapa subsp. narinosa]
MTIDDLSTRVDENKPPCSGNDVDGEKASTPDPRWPYLNRWSSSLGKDVSTPAESIPDPSLLTAPTVESASNTLPTEVSTNLAILVAPAISDAETAEVPSDGSPALSHELILAVENSPPPDGASNQSIEQDEMAQEEMVQEPVFVRSLGAWAKPLHFSTPPTPSEPATPKLGISEAIKAKLLHFGLQLVKMMAIFGFLGQPV